MSRVDTIKWNVLQEGGGKKNVQRPETTKTVPCRPCVRSRKKDEKRTGKETSTGRAARKGGMGGFQPDHIVTNNRHKGTHKKGMLKEKSPDGPRG